MQESRGGVLFARDLPNKGLYNDGETCWLNSAFQFLNRTSITHILCGTKNII